MAAKKCKYCKKDLTESTAWNKKFCGVRCAKAFYRWGAYVERYCLQCGEPMPEKSNKRVKYCSEDCTAIYRRNLAGPPRVCIRCGVEIQRQKGGMRPSSYVYCSAECHAAVKKDRRKTATADRRGANAARRKRYREELSDPYVLIRLGLKREEATPELIEVKRQLMRIKRIVVMGNEKTPLRRQSKGVDND